MRFTRTQLAVQSRRRPQGYEQDVLALATEVDGGFELSDEAFRTLAEKYRAPSLIEKATNFGRSTILAINRPEPRSDEEIAQIAQICAQCEHYVPRKNTCGLCGCNLRFKPQLKAWHCPKGKW